MAFTNDDILTLARAGFTSEQIIKLSQIQSQQQAQPQQMAQPQLQQQPQMYPQQMIQPQAQPQQMVQPQMYPQQMIQPQAQPQQLPDGSGFFIATTPADTPKQDPFHQLFEQMTGIKQAIQNNNIQNSVIQTKPETTDDILASIIQPTNSTKEDTK